MQYSQLAAVSVWNQPGENIRYFSLHFLNYNITSHVMWTFKIYHINPLMANDL
jgi:hypothetical protein